MREVWEKGRYVEGSAQTRTFGVCLVHIAHLQLPEDYFFILEFDGGLWTLQRRRSLQPGYRNNTYSLTCRRNSGSEIMKQEDESFYLECHWRDKGGRSSELSKKPLSQCYLNINTLFWFVKTKISCLTWTEFPWFMLYLPHVVTVTLHTGTLLRLNTPDWALLVINSNCLCSFHQLLLQMMARKRWD